MLSSPLEYEQNVGENVSERVQNSDGARGVAKAELSAETPSRDSAAESPGGPFGPRPSDDPVVCPCGENHNARETLGSVGFGLGSQASDSDVSGVSSDSDVSGHEIYCGCPSCLLPRCDSPPSAAGCPYDFCPGCNEICDDEFCFCADDCTICDHIDLALEQFTFTSTPDLLPQGDYQDC
ncbi:hypothetical protein LCGC14_1677950, partial [marine sediment metagenome]